MRSARYLLLAAALTPAALDASGQDMMPTPAPTPSATISPAPKGTPSAPPLQHGKKRHTPGSLDPVLTPAPTPGGTNPGAMPGPGGSQPTPPVTITPKPLGS